MTLVVDLGLERFRPLECFALLEQFVTCGYTTLVRDVIGSKVVEVFAYEEPGAKKKPKTIMASSRWVPAADAKKIVREVDKLYKSYGTYASFSWGELDGVGATDIRDFALVLDGPEKTGFRPIVTLDTYKLGVVDLDVSAKNWRGTKGNIGFAAKLHALAKKHRLVVHSA